MSKEKCENCTEKRLKQETEEMLSKYEKKEDNLIKILEEIQVKYGYIPKICAYKVSTPSFSIFKCFPITTEHLKSK